MTDAAVSQLIRTFGNFDREVLEAVLAVNDGDVKLATEFLQAEQGGYALDLNQPQDGVPQDYPSQIIPAGVVPQTNNSATGKMKALFLAEASLEDHFNAQKEDYDIYASVLLLLLNQGVEISKASRTRILACCWARNDHDLADHLIYSHEDLFSLPQILPALNLLDAPRKIREIEKKIARLENSKIKTKPKKIGALKSLINDLNRETHIGSVSGALSKRIRNWARSIPEEKLSFFALSLPKEPWRQLADLIHLNPKKDFKIDWFLNAIFDEKLGADNILTACENITQENCLEIAKKYKVPYSFLRVNIKPLPENVKPIIANYETLDTLIWYFEELVHPEVYKIVDARLTSGEVPKFGYGKLMERRLLHGLVFFPVILSFIPLKITGAKNKNENEDKSFEKSKKYKKKRNSEQIELSKINSKINSKTNFYK